MTDHVEFFKYKGWSCSIYLDFASNLYAAIANKNGHGPIGFKNYRSTACLAKDIKQIIDSQSVQSAPEIRCQVLGGSQ